MKKVYDFLDKASQAANWFSRYYHSSLNEQNEYEESFGWESFDIFTMSSNDGNQITFNEACQELINSYEKIACKYDSYEYADGFSFIVEEQMRSLDEMQRNVLISRIIKRSSNLIINGWWTINSTFQINADIIDTANDINQMFKGFEAVGFFLEGADKFLCNIGDLCQDYHINVQEMCLNIFDYVSSDILYLSVFEPRFGTSIIEGKKAKSINKKGDFTLYRKKEAIITMLEALGVKQDGAGAIPDSQLKKFVYFLTGNGTIEDDIRNTAVADVFKPGKDIRNNATINKDLDFVAARFEDIGLFDLAQKVKNGKI